MPMTGTPDRVAAAVRAGWGCALLLAPERLLALGAGAPVPPAAVTVVRVLGARQVLQGAVTAWMPTPAVTGLGAVVDALHGATCVGLAALSPRWRRVGLADAVIAAALIATRVTR